MQVLEILAPAVEVYSIDEAFLDLSGITNVVALEQFGQQIKATTAQWVGITVGVGMAPTKTLANYAAKKWPAAAGNEYLHSAGSGRYAAHAAEKLRQEQQYCRVVLVFMRTSPFAGNELKYSHHAAVTLPLPRIL
ncbi:hypothetical protein [Oceanimonas sp. CAM02]|uniref:Y-family DNA polymerase n=1 Tax=Oceanimonas sp. CAM02 TaxID=3080336 RepID=UPI0029359662|nr:hypothetical protein [Oceanimonas sp. CAM02]MDV2858469.1 hypothetical protein [Oceanimonas sp. CAM02]